MGSGDVVAKWVGALTTKTAAAVAAGTLVVAGAAGAGVWWVDRGTPVAVVQRSTTATVGAGGQQAAAAACLPHESALGGGYAVTGTGFATSSQFLGASAWAVVAYNPGDAPATLTTYALCVNAKVEKQPGLDFNWRAHAFKDRGNKILGTPGTEPIRDLTTDGPYAEAVGDPLGDPRCGNEFTMVGSEFRAGRIIAARPVQPVPLDSLIPNGALPGAAWAAPWTVSVNPGTALSSEPFPMPRSEDILRKTRILDPQPPQSNFAVGARPVCVKLKDASVVTAKVTVAAGGRAESTLTCPKGRSVVGGGFSYPAANERGALEAPQRYFGDGYLFAAADAPAAGEPSGTKVQAWHVTGVNQQKPGAFYHDSAWIEHSDRETSTGNGYFDTHPHSGEDQPLRTSDIPAAQEMITAAVCAKIDAEPTEPAKGAAPPAVTRVDVPPLDVVAPPAATPSPSVSAPGASPSPSPAGSASPSTTPHTPNSPSASASATPSRPGNTPRTSAPPSPPTRPTVTIDAPGSGAGLRRGCQETFAGTARAHPGEQLITDPQRTGWQIQGPNGAVTLGAGASGRFTVPLLPDGTYPLVFTATDPASGLTGSAQVSVRIVGCIR
ncbi:hypothetical protein ACIBEA_23110 [Streptomyces sp. NPDC051555]|uniref:hypothetical protein n=1 Tax=Streptomyces sp. NPDC051555 TaxID=3365657 RepID=UPI0037990A51